MGARARRTRLFLAGALAAAAAAEPSPEPAPTPWSAPSPELAARFETAVRLEDEERFLEAAEIFEKVAAALPSAGHPRWRAARAWVREAARLPLAEKERRLELFERADRAAREGVEREPGCAECHLYRFVALSRMATTQGIWSAARQAKEMTKVLERALELGPTHVDSAWNQEIANLHFAAGVLYRVLPDSSMAKAVLGVRGDPARALAHLRRAVEITPSRIDYRMELGATLLCLGSRGKQAGALEEGKAVLAAVETLPDRQWSDPVDRAHERVLRAEPARACGYGRDEWIAEGVGVSPGAVARDAPG
jgi:tetratricopeptide (TPR) repeat protein